MFKKSIYLSQCPHSMLLRLLYYEAKENVIDGRYPVKLKTANELAGMQALMETGRHDAALHDTVFFK